MAIKEKAPVRFRHELKFAIHQGDALELSHRLGKLFPHDKHADSRGLYRVSSLYFDTPCDKALREKLDGVNRREKFRLRYYNDDLSFIRLEKKLKQNGLCGKYSARLTGEEAARLIAGDCAFLPKREEPLLAEFYAKLRGGLLRPKTVVTYQREAFLFAPGNVRVTIDRELRAGLSPSAFLTPTQQHVDLSEGLAVLEVKYDEFLPDIVAMAAGLQNRRAAAFSKYAVCRRLD